MTVVLLFNTEYIKKQYNLNEKFIKKLEIEVIPDLIERLSSEDCISNIDVYSNTIFDKEKLLSSKIKFLDSDTGFDDNSVSVIKKYFGHSSSTKSDIYIFLNPLFPFVSVKHLSQGYESVASDKVNTSIGAIKLGVDITNNDKNLDDWGIFTVLRKDMLNNSQSRIIYPSSHIYLNAIELISLRQYADLELYDLIINSGVLG